VLVFGAQTTRGAGQRLCSKSILPRLALVSLDSNMSKELEPDDFAFGAGSLFVHGTAAVCCVFLWVFFFVFFALLPLCPPLPLGGFSEFLLYYFFVLKYVILHADETCCGFFQLSPARTCQKVRRGADSLLSSFFSFFFCFENFALRPPKSTMSTFFGNKTPHLFH
jgi:hypothetical protein